MLVSYANMALVDVEEVVFFITTNGRGKRRCKREKGFQSHKKIKFWQYFQISIFFLSHMRQ